MAKLGWFFFLLLTSLFSTAKTPDAGEVAPNFSLPVLGSSETVSLEDFRGQIVLLDFWASWCGPCLVSMPFYQQMQDEYTGQAFKVIAVSVDEEAEPALDFIQDRDLNMLFLHDITGSLAAKYQLPGMPTSFLLDADGTIVDVQVGFNKAAKPGIKKQVEQLMRALQ